MRYMIDTSVWIHALWREIDTIAVETISDVLESGQAATCPVIILEILTGVKSNRDFVEIKSEFLTLHNVKITDAVWSSAYRMGHELRKKGVTVPATDMLIAAAALSEDCTLIHRDRHFDLISKHCGLKVRRI